MDTAEEIIKYFIRIRERPNVLEEYHKKLFEGMRLAEVHCIDKIGSIEDANVTKIATEMHMTRGAISKICKKLLCRKLIDSYQKPENNKEVYFNLTEEGKEIYFVHKKYHDRAIQSYLDMLTAYTEDEEKAILKFLQAMNVIYDKQSAVFSQVKDKEEV
ncbi:MarR family transcriptional regulator [Pectinatus cerevisiiphilus]|uniref:DNA-binding MarR family transcriptional regulator n=1 Tax=Pectinatus cerevisiiphilus TaxID=86956 RepID=A0A4R3K5Z7_9FIRM|nr:MarR family transcriptional regulator [Pectinatus cerevisiiphilus]TCS78157.1 DNA-binding MarR family transcriptional regulator [Pectinatus cerevisiiphilus]